ncbi:MAG: CocE/NonD family hydrolase, partial [Actinomycetota bacterium]|nr:CocE/NonD family hydrolase [Actinomycetota bacterium]
GGEVGMIGVSTGATLAILAAKDPALDGRVSVVAGIAPYADIRTVLSIATTGYYREGGELVRYEAEPFLSYVAARSLVATLPPGEDRRTLLSELDGVDRLDPNPLSVFRDRPLGDLGPEARSVVKLLANRDPGRFDDLYAELPEKTRADLAELSPLAGDGRIEAPVELASAPRDRYFPTSESYALKSIAPDLRVTVTDALDHADLEFSPARLPAFFRMNGFVVRSLREARLADSRDAGDQRVLGTGLVLDAPRPHW